MKFKKYIFWSKRHPLDYNWDELDPELKIASVGGFWYRYFEPSLVFSWLFLSVSQFAFLAA